MNKLKTITEKLSTEQLIQLLREELEKADLNGDRVRQILQILESREEPLPPMDARTAAAWAQYCKGCREDAQKRTRFVPKLGVMAAVVALVALLAIPFAWGSGDFFARIGAWKDTVLEFFEPTEVQQTYIFQTDNPGLQKLYDEVTALGVTQPVVPTWVPEGSELIDLKINRGPTKISLYSAFAANKSNIVIIVNVYGADSPREYEKNDSKMKIMEMAGIQHYIIENDDAWMALWFKDNIECSVTVDCGADTLEKMLESIYVMEAD